MAVPIETKEFKFGGMEPIPDNDAGGAYIEGMVPDDESFPLIADLDIDLIVEHSNQGDLRIWLEHVTSGTMAVLMDRPGMDGSNPFGFSADNLGNPGGTAGNEDKFFFDDDAFNVYDVPAVQGPGIDNVTGSWIPENPLSVFNGLDKRGVWRLHVADLSGGDTGSILNFSLHFVNEVPGPGPLALLGAAGLATVGRRRD